MSNRIDITFQHLRENKEAAFVAYICAGDPSYNASLEIAKSLADAGADIIELGVPSLTRRQMALSTNLLQSAR